MNIDTYLQIDDLTLIKHLKSINSQFLPGIKEVYESIKDILNSRVQHVFPNYTLHNTEHSFRIIEYMSKLVGDCTKLSELEITLLIYSALLHDIGMAVSETDIDAIRSDSFPFCEVKFSAMKKLMGDDEKLALQEYVRRIHAGLSGRYIRENLKDKLVVPKLPTLDFTQELAFICESHTQDYDWIKSRLRTNEVRGDFTFNPQYIAVILRLADILDIDGNRTPYNLYKLIAPQGVSDEEWKQHYVISNNEKIVFNDSTQQKKIVFHGKCTSARIHRKILVYIGWVKDEIINATALVSGMSSQYRLLFDTNPEINIQPEGYTFSDYKMTLEYRAISNLLMGEKIYGYKNLGLRELIQNSIDSCRLRQETEGVNLEFEQDAYTPIIKVILDKDKNQVIIKDNGTGMSLDIIKKHFLNIGVSYYNSSEFLLKDYEYKPIGNFGIGFLACFMLSDDVKVITRHYKSKHKYVIELEKGNEYTSLTESEDVEFHGTEVILNYKHFMTVFENSVQRVKDFLNSYFLTDGIKFELVDKSEKQKSAISNLIILSEPLEKGVFRINFKDYLNNIEGYALIKNKKTFINKFDDLVFTGEVFTYDNDCGFEHIEDFTKLEINDYIDNEKIKYIAIPLIPFKIVDDFMSGMKFTSDNFDEVIEKLDREIKWISLIVPKENQAELIPFSIEINDAIFEGLLFEDLVKLGHSATCPTKVYIKSINLFEGRKNEIYLPFDESENDYIMYSWRMFGKRKELFMRSVLIKNFRFSIPISTSIFEINTIVTNINSKQFIPDISRNNVSSEVKDTINYIIGKAIHVGACDVLQLGMDEKTTLQNFIAKFYSERTRFEI